VTQATAASVEERLRQLICDLGTFMRDAVLQAREEATFPSLSAVAEETASDTIYQIDKASDAAVDRWMCRHWPADLPVAVLMEGLEANAALRYPDAETAPEWLLLLDPIDGTRMIMYDKRSAWVLAGIAPFMGTNTRLSHIVAAAMTEIPPTRQWASDQLSATLGCGPDGVVARRTNLLDASQSVITPSPSPATDLQHGFASFAKFFPEGKSALVELESELLGELGLVGSSHSPVVFDDQYISSGGQLYELITGHDRMVADVRGLILPAVGHKDVLCAHPYDLVTWLIAREAGCVVENPLGGPLEDPMDTTTSVSWVGYANEELARTVRPVLKRLLHQRMAAGS
jgi:hypothetical protein